MIKLKLSDNKKYFVDETGKPFFYLADTSWATFSRASTEEWEQYLDIRKKQGFNACQFSVLPIIHDRSYADGDLHPYQLNEKGAYDFDRINETYFDYAEEILKMTVDAGMVPVLTLIWVNYIANSWANKRGPEYTINEEQADKLVCYCIERFKKYNPMYFLSGDANLGEEIDLTIYRNALKRIRELDPDALVSTHICGRNSTLPEDFKTDDGLDFYCYQSGHPHDAEDEAYNLAIKMKEFNKKPILSSEVRYEGHCKSWSILKHSAYDVRRAAWESYFGGAQVGISYGAHGIWSWHRNDSVFTNDIHSASVPPWYEGVRFEGAWDLTFMKWICEKYGLCDFDTYELKLTNLRDYIKMYAMKSADGEKMAMYFPFQTNVYVEEDLTEYEWEVFDLEKRCPFVPEVEKWENGSCVKFVSGNEDTLYIGVRRKQK